MAGGSHMDTVPKPIPYAGITQIRFARVGGIRPPSQPGSTELPYVPGTFFF